MAGTEKQKQSLYFPDETLQEIMRESNRLDRSLSWTVQQAWRLARAQVRTFPTAERGDEGARGSAVSPVRAAQSSGQRIDELERRRPSAQVREFLKGKFDHELTG